ncbi:SNF2-related protein [Verrucomicrobiota bacterium]
MSIANALAPNFSPAVQHRGRQYEKKGLVRVESADNSSIQAIVNGTSPYKVNITFDYNTKSTGINCTCPYFESHGPCKHLWATIVAIDKQQAFYNIPPYSEDIDDLKGFLEPDFDDDDTTQPQYKNKNVRRGSFNNISHWRTIIRTIKHSLPASQHLRPAGIGEISYLINVPETLRGKGLSLDVMSRRPKKNAKGLTKFKPVRIKTEKLTTLPDHADRKIITLLLGGEAGDPYYRSYGQNTCNGKFILQTEFAKILLPECAATGRLGLIRNQADLKNPPPLTYDSGEPWKFNIRVRNDKKRNEYILEGELKRGKERMPLSAPCLVTESGFTVTNDAVAELNHLNMFEWVYVLRKNKEIRVPKKDGGTWLKSMFEFPELPPMTLPKELKYKKETPKPSPFLKILRSEKQHTDHCLGAVLSFDYNGTVIQFSAKPSGIFDSDKRLLIQRDNEAEAIFASQLRQHGFTTAMSDPSSFSFYNTKPRYEEKVHFEIPSNRFTKGITALIRLGWKVEAEGVKYRSGSSVSISVRSGIDWFELGGKVDFDGESVPFPIILKAMKKGESLVTLSDGSKGVLPDAWLEKYSLLAGSATIKGDSATFTRSQAALLDALLSAEPNLKADKVFARFMKELKNFKSIKPVSRVSGFKCDLREYQKEGLGWMRFLQKMNFGGCLADDMGLGKTVQALGILQSRCKTKGRTSLIVVPKSIVINWIQEAHRFAPKLRVLNHTGSQRDSGTDSFSDYDIVITTYGLLRQDIINIKEFKFDYIILDESQIIKNSYTIAAKAVRLLSSTHRLAMSGTPVENHLGELWSLFEFLNPGMLGMISAFNSVLTDSSKEIISEERRAILSRALRPFILRRTKEQVAPELPKKTEETIICEMPPAQRKIYNEVRDYYRESLINKVDTEGIKKQKLIVLEALLRLRQIACHPGLIDKKKISQSSVKLDLLIEQIADVTEEDHKILVFSQFTSLLKIVRARLDSNHTIYEYLDGQTRKRGKKVERFQTDPECKVFLISLKAGGLGLNLTAADYVVLMDPWWNPAVEMQAIDRAHRIGQTKPVFAYRLVAKDTVEERILELQQTKKKLADSIISADNSLIKDLKREDLELLLS